MTTAAIEVDDLRDASARLLVTDRARRVLGRLRRDYGPQALLLSWPGGVTCLPAAMFVPSTFDVIVGHIAGCPIHADLRQLACYRDRRAILDVLNPSRRSHPVVSLRPLFAGRHDAR
jgi:uncharacterized protein (DUF779 family)